MFLDFQKQNPRIQRRYCVLPAVLLFYYYSVVYVVYPRRTIWYDTFWLISCKLLTVMSRMFYPVTTDRPCD